MRPCFAGFESLVPGMIKVFVASSATGFEPRASATTAISLTGFLDGTTFGTYGTDGCFGDYGYLYVGIGLRRKEENTTVF